MLKYLLLILFCCLLSCETEKGQEQTSAPQMQFIKAVKQKGPVAYRDPFGAISPDGKLFAYSDRKQILVQQVVGGATFELEKHGTFVITLTWLPDSQHLVTYEIGGDREYWYIYDLLTKQGLPLWPDRKVFSNNNLELDRADIKDLTWSSDGQQVAGLSKNDGKTQMWIMNNIGEDEKVIAENELIESIQWNPSSNSFAGIIEENGKRSIQLDLANSNSEKIKVDSYGPIAFSPDGQFLYFSLANEKEVIDLQQYDMKSKSRTQLASFSRDSYAPSVAKDGSVLFRLQDYKVFIAAVDGDGGESKPITTFMSEISHWHPDGKLLSFTYGNWRRVMDDRNYPDITQEIGYVNFDMNQPKDKPDVVVRASYSEDQGMAWSPNNKWIAFHTHADGTDDIWIQPNNDASKGKPLSKGGYETGWPRWSPDGKWIVSNTAPTSDRINKLFLIGINQETGEPTTEQIELVPPGLEEGSFTDSQWMNDSKNLIVEYVVTPELKEIHIVPIDGKPGKKIHSFNSDQLYSGIALSHDQKWVAYIAPDEKGNFQVFKVSIDGKVVKQLTFDATNKAHPAGSPTDNIFSFTVFNYESIFWLMKP
ncbi:MAG: PD40 domain-containing protein [Cyclobacteriaceae bacterium]|nr:PD40 domain-containing protein [Cyclobacteriaceae bacterium]